MPGPAVYVLAAFATAGIFFALKEFVYEPHIVPMIEEYQNNRRRRQGPVPVSQRYNPTDGDRETDIGRRKPRDRTPESDDDSDDERYGPPHGSSNHWSRDDVELEDLVAHEVREWQRSSTSAGLRLRRNVGNVGTNSLDESNNMIPFVAISPTRPDQPVTPSSSSTYTPRHVLYDPSRPLTPSTPSTTRTSSSPLPRIGQGDAPSNSILFSTRATSSTPALLPNDHETSTLSSLATSPILPRFPSVPHSVPQSEAPPSPSPSPPKRYSPEQLAKDLPSVPRHRPGLASSATSGESPTTPIAIPRRECKDTAAEDMGSLPFSVSSIQTVKMADYAVFRTPADDSAVISIPRVRTPLPSPLPAGVSTQSATSPSPPTLPSTSNLPASVTASTATSYLALASTSPSISPSPSPHLASLSQIYPQDLDDEHGVVLLSPPSSRSDSPFSVVSSAEGATGTGPLGSPFIAFGAFGALGQEAGGGVIAKAPEYQQHLLSPALRPMSVSPSASRSPVSPWSFSPTRSAEPSAPQSTESRYISLPASTLASTQGSPLLLSQDAPSSVVLAESVSFDASYPHISDSSNSSPLPPVSSPPALPLNAPGYTRTRVDPFADPDVHGQPMTPTSPRTPTSSTMTLSDIGSDWEHDEDEFTGPQSHAQVDTLLRFNHINSNRFNQEGFDTRRSGSAMGVTSASEDEDDAFSDSGISEASSLSSWASVEGGSGNNTGGR